VNGAIQAVDYGVAGSANIYVGDDTYLTDIDTANTLGIYGVQNNTVATIKLGSTGPTISGSGTTVTINDGSTGKLNVGTIDPVYTIGGKRYATYVPSMTGQKEETAGVVHVTCNTQHATGSMLQDTCSVVLDFGNAPEGSDLWLFSKTTDLKDNFDKMTALLTASFEGRVWYEKDASRNRLTIYALPTTYDLLPTNLEVSYRFTAPRFDAASWSNYSDASSAGFIINN
jgi:hypothetical protein